MLKFDVYKGGFIHAKIWCTHLLNFSAFTNFLWQKNGIEPRSLSCQECNQLLLTKLFTLQWDANSDRRS